jgi:hypothetical protein
VHDDRVDVMGCVTEPRPQTVVFFITHVIHEHREIWLNGIGGEKAPDSPTRALWQSYQQSSSSKAGGLAKEMIFFPYKVSLSYFEGFFKMPKNLTTWG